MKKQTSIAQALEFMNEERRQLFAKIEQSKADGDELGKRLSEIDKVIGVIWVAAKLAETVSQASQYADLITTEQ